MSDSTPILIGAGQITQRDTPPDAAREPIELMREAALRAADDARLPRTALPEVDSISVVNVLSWPYANAPRLLAERLGAAPREELYTAVGGNTPQWLVNETAARIADGRVGLALLAGAEAVHSVVRARKGGVALRWTTQSAAAPRTVGDGRPGSSEHEAAHGFVLPVQIYPLFENALRARAGRGIAEHARVLGGLCASLAEVARDNPFAWFRTPRTADEIATVGEQNRMISFPYPKLMNSILDVDQGAAVLMTSVGEAKRRGVPRDRWVFLQGFADAHDHWHVSDRVDYASSPAIAACARRALEMAGTRIEDVSFLDVYSCFPSAVQIGRDALGIAADDPRPLTVTGGLAAFGGPGSNYSMHAIATMLDLLRATPGTRGLVTALGWYVTKHAVGVYGTEPGPAPWPPGDAGLQPELDALPHPPLELGPEGPATIETYTVSHGRDGTPERGLVIGRLDDGRRFLATVDGDRATLEALEQREAVGLRGRARTDGMGLGRFAPG